MVFPAFPTLFRPRHLVMPLDSPLATDSPSLAEFVLERLFRGDPGPLEIVDGVASTPLWDLELARAELLELLAERGEARAAGCWGLGTGSEGTQA